MKRILYFVLTLWIFLWAQVVSNHYLGGTLFSVQWILLAVLHFGLIRGPWVGETMGFIWGLLVDASSLGLLGLHAMLYALAGRPKSPREEASTKSPQIKPMVS